MAYANRYYNPNKAHEYYERTKVLKGYENRYGGSRGNGTSAASGGYTGSKKLLSNSSRVDGRELGLTESINRRDSLEAKARRKDIKGEISSLRQQLEGMSKEDRKANRQVISDQIQKLREEVNSGFNKASAVADIKTQMEQDRASVVRQFNNATDSEMLSKVKKLQADITSLQKSGNEFNRKALGAQVKAMLGETKKVKERFKAKLKKEYSKKYKNKIEKIRGEKSTRRYYDQESDTRS